MTTIQLIIFLQKLCKEHPEIEMFNVKTVGEYAYLLDDLDIQIVSDKKEVHILA